MTTSTLFHTQGTRGFKYDKTYRKNGTEYYYICSSAKEHCCPNCSSTETSIVETGKRRELSGLHVGFKKTIFRVNLRRIVCRDCKSSRQEPIDFCAGPSLRYTKWLAKYVLGLRKEMSIRAVAQLTGLHWDGVKQIEKTYLLQKHKEPALNKVQYMGIDEVYLGKTLDYITVVRDLLSGAVLFIGKGKRHLLLRNQENLSSDAARELKKLRFDFKDLGTASLMKEYLRNIYRMADCVRNGTICLHPLV